jgi:hypothetical protein
MKLTVKKTVVTKTAKPSGVFPTVGCPTLPPLCR